MVFKSIYLISFLRNYWMNKNISIEAKIEPGVITVNDSSVLEETRTLKYPWKKTM